MSVTEEHRRTQSIDGESTARGETLSATAIGAGRRNARSLVRRLTSIVALLGFWYLAAAATDQEILFPGPQVVWSAALEMVRDGSLLENSVASIQRILIGFSIGSLIGAPIGLLMGSSKVITDFLDPYIEFFRFIPALSLVTLALIWFGPGEMSKYFLIAYATSFVIVVNTIAGVAAVPQAQRRAASSLGAGRVQEFCFVILPASVPYILTGMRIAMAYAFATIVAAEMVAAQSGIGYLIFSSRLFLQTDRIFVGIAVLGIMGYVADRLLRLLASRGLRRYVEHIGA